MKSMNLLKIIIMSVSVTSCSIQKNSVINIYAYSQQVIPGKVSKSMEEGGGSTHNKMNLKKNYFLYVENLKNTKVGISDIWIDAIHYTVKIEPLLATPVEVSGFDEFNIKQLIELVPKTTNPVYLVIPESFIEEKADKKQLIEMINSSELVVGFMYKSKKYYSSLKKIKELKPAISQ